MTGTVPAPQIAILDAGGQYCHLIARKVRELGVYSEIFPSDTPVSELKGRKGIIISGGPASVYEPGSPQMDTAVLSSGAAILGICYGQQLMAHLLGGKVRKGTKGEYGLAQLHPEENVDLFEGAPGRQQIWMSHRDTVEEVPEGFQIAGTTGTCAVAAMVDKERRLYGVQFHPEVVHTANGRRILENFIFRICGCHQDWDPRDRVPAIEREIRETVGDRNVFFFVSGGVDSTVAYTLCLRALGDARVHGLYVDTGLMRQGETEFVRSLFAALGSHHFAVEDASSEFLGALNGVREPEKKRHIIGQKFVDVQERILQSGHFLDGHWILGQGTIYPDTIESGGTAKAEVIKTHHNRVAGIQRLIEAGRIVEPLHSFYKDEVREIGREVGVPEHFLERHPFPGPGLAIRCLCAEDKEPIRRIEQGYVIPVHSVGVQGDSRTYKPILAIEGDHLHERAVELINALPDVNRVVAVVRSKALLELLEVHQSALSLERLDRLRAADAIVRDLSASSGFEQKVWQFPVVLIPVGTEVAPDTVVLRPIHSVDGMTAQSVEMPLDLLDEMSARILEIAGIAAVFYDLTNKPPATIEWE